MSDSRTAPLGSDAHRIDRLVEDLGEVKGDVRTVRHQIAGVADGVAELNKALAILMRHELLMEQYSSKVTAVIGRVESVDMRLQHVEKEMPGLIEGRADVRKVFWLVIATVVMAALALVVTGGKP